MRTRLEQLLLVLFVAAPTAAPSAASAAAQEQLADYRLVFEPGGELWRVEARFDGRGQEELEYRIPVWTPGAYHPADYGRFVTELEARDGKDAKLEVERPDNGHFVVHLSGQENEIVIRYSARSISTGTFTEGIIDVESNRIAKGYAYVNPVSLFGYVAGRIDEPLRLTVELPEGWEAATVLAQDEQGAFLAPSFYRFEDSPLFFSPALQLAEFEVDGKPHRVSVHGRDHEATVEIAAGCRRIVEASSALMGGLPYDRYHFIYGFADENGGSGLEHSFSTLILVNPRMEISEDSESFWGLTAHEFFHLWCAERIHVQEIHEPDFTEPVETGTIWVNEGITEYFSRQILFHAGFYDAEELLGTYLLSRVPPEAMRKQAWTDVSRATVDWNGMADLMTFAMRMYMQGPRTIFALDLTMRKATGGERGILDLLHYLMENYVEQDRGFGEEELDDILESVAGAEAVTFYERYIDGDENPEPADFMEIIGYRAVEGRAVPLDDATPDQLAARRDYFSVSGRP